MFTATSESGSLYQEAFLTPSYPERFSAGQAVQCMVGPAHLKVFYKMQCSLRLIENT